ncbi:hypothetical protein [Alicyclobacillus vulcanalis]|uniref:Uncharacterized protein n=1 Tax=Alicyclobacillus vulcanalis TaxID=252246 RepID=A0A1N7PL99_9BACL|nr:hypothetical protein [Alicyclobacillus vulcanalis]SIT11423.1 hypothetical protein SAMN05421799_11470 [Alicyclobacillus vulcanalis]
MNILYIIISFGLLFYISLPFILYFFKDKEIKIIFPRLNNKFSYQENRLFEICKTYYFSEYETLLGEWTIMKNDSHRVKELNILKSALKARIDEYSEPKYSILQHLTLVNVFLTILNFIYSLFGSNLKKEIAHTVSWLMVVLVVMVAISYFIHQRKEINRIKIKTLLQWWLSILDNVLDSE